MMYDLRAEVLKIYLKNREERDGFQYTLPSSTSYPHQWLWDSCFHAIVLTHFNVEDAKKELRGLVSGQFENGMIPHIIFRTKDWFTTDIKWGTKDTSSLTQPPLIAYAVWQIFKKDGDHAFLEEMYPQLDAFYRYLLTRDIYEHHLIGIINPDESGEDDSPRFDKELGLPPVHLSHDNNKKRFALIEKNLDWSSLEVQKRDEFFWVEDVPYNVYIVENLEILARISKELRKTEEANYFAREASSIKDAMRKYMIKDGIYWSIAGRDAHKIKIKTWAMFAPLVIGGYTESEAKNLIENFLLNKDEFLSMYPVPTTAMSEDGYHPDEFHNGPASIQPNWRGPVWMTPNWFVYRGLKRYGYNDIAEEIKNKSQDLLEKSGFREYYHPITGHGMGAEDFTWGGLVLDMAESEVESKNS